MHHFFRLPNAVILLFFLLFFCNEVAAQTKTKRAFKKQNSYRKQQNHRTSNFTGKRIKFANSRQYMTIGVSANALNYFGDVTPRAGAFSTDLSFTRAGVGVSSGLRIGPQFSVQTGLMWGRLRGDDFESANPEDNEAIYRYVRNLQFRNDVIDFSLSGVFDLIPNQGTVFTRAIFTPYIFAGVSVFHHNPMAKVPQESFLYGTGTAPVMPENAGKWVALKPLQTEGPDAAYSNFQFSLPVGIGVRQQISQSFDIEFEFSYRFMFFDYIDDVSGNYADKGVLTSDLAKIMSDRSREPTAVISGKDRLQPILDSEQTKNVVTYQGADGVTYGIFPGYGQPNQIRGNPSDNDIYLTTTIRLVYMLGRSPFEKVKGGKRYIR